MKRCSMTLVIREMEMKTSMRYHLMLIRMVTIKTQSIPSVGQDLKTGTLTHC